MTTDVFLGPHTMTVLCTYQCTAACRQCCFESSPKVKGRLSKGTIIKRISEAKASFPKTLKMVVFSGGEAMMLKDDLIQSIKFCSENGLMTRVVSNGYWGKTEEKAEITAKKLKNAGLCEINISTGRDHLEWVPLSSAINAIVATVREDIQGVITVESDGDGSVLRAIYEDKNIIPHIESGILIVQSNSWMPFHSNAEKRDQKIDKNSLREGCGQVFENIVVTPHDNLSSCCGLTLEHIPEMRLGKNSGKNMRDLYMGQLEDFMKLWIKVEGPYSIIEKVMGPDSKNYLDGAVHICEVCATLHKNGEIKSAIKNRYQEFVHEIVTRFWVKAAMDARCL